MELDNFREDVLVELLIDALERVIDGAEYYYAAAQEALASDDQPWSRRGGSHAHIQRAVREQLRNPWSAPRELRDRLRPAGTS